MVAYRPIVVALAVVIAPLAFAPADAGPSCLAVDAAAFHEIATKGPLPGFDGWTFAVGYSMERLPPVPTALAVRGGEACDLTHGFVEFLGALAAPATEDAALATSILAVSTVLVDVFPDAVLLPALDLAAESPVVTAVPGGFASRFTAWTPRNGVVARFDVTLDGDVSTRFIVLANARGPFVGETHGWLLSPGDTDGTLAEVGALDTERVIMGTNLDGTQWRVRYYVDRYGNDEDVASYHANMHLTAAIAAYAETYGWGFRSADPDRILDLTLSGCDCISAGYQAYIRMFPRANDILPLLPGLRYRSEAEVAQLIVGHELFHHMQYSIQRWRFGAWTTEGQARFSETVHVPDFTFLPTTLTYWPNLNGMNGFILTADRRISGHSYDFSIVWGYLQAANGGMALIKAVLEEQRTGGTAAETDGVAAIDRALARFPGRAHATFADAYADFVKALYTHEGFTWGKADGTQRHDWSTYFRPVVRQAADRIEQRAIEHWGIHYLDAAPKPDHANAVAAVVVDDASTWARLLSRTPAGFESADVTPAATTTTATDAVVAVVRGSGAYGPGPASGAPGPPLPAPPVTPPAPPEPNYPPPGTYFAWVAR